MEQNDPSAAISTQNPPAPKRKLNWKGFAFGVVAVIIIEFLAIAMLQSGDPQIQIQETISPTIQTPVSPSISPTITSVPKR